jgi:hypothetical protein
MIFARSLSPIAQKKPQTHASSMFPRTACPACCIPGFAGSRGPHNRSLPWKPGRRIESQLHDLVGYGSGDSAVCGEAEHINEKWR